MLTVHHLNNSRSQRVLWLLEELGVPYEIKHYQRGPDMLAPKELLAVHSLGKSPVITDNGNTVAESGAIIEYIVETYGNGRLIPPPKTAERLRYTYWLHYAEGSAMTPLLQKLIFSMLPRRSPAADAAGDEGDLEAAAGEHRRSASEAAHGITGSRSSASPNGSAGNEFTAADVQMSFPLEAAAARGGLEIGHPKCMAFLEKIHARPAYHRALVRGGPYAIGR